MTTQQAIEKTFTQSEIAAMLAEITDILKISPPCETTKKIFEIEIVGLVERNSKAALAADFLQSALQGIMKL